MSQRLDYPEGKFCGNNVYVLLQMLWSGWMSSLLYAICALITCFLKQSEVASWFSSTSQRHTSHFCLWFPSPNSSTMCLVGASDNAVSMSKIGGYMKECSNCLISRLEWKNNSVTLVNLTQALPCFSTFNIKFQNYPNALDAIALRIWSWMDLC